MDGEGWDYGDEDGWEQADELPPSDSLKKENSQIVTQTLNKELSYNAT